MAFAHTMKSSQHNESPRSARKEPQFIFVNISDPSQNSAPDVQKIVRSHTTHAQHVRRKDEDWSPHRKSRAYSPRSITAWAIDHDRTEHASHRRRASQPVNSTSGSGLQFITENIQPLNRRSLRSIPNIKRPDPRRRSLGGDSATSQGSPVLPPIERLAVSHEDSPSASSVGSSTGQTEPSSIHEEVVWDSPPSASSPGHSPEKADPFATLEAYASSLDTTMSTVVDHFTWMTRVQSPDFELKYAIEHNAVTDRFIPFVLAEPVLLSAVTLFTISHLRYIRGQPHASLDLLRLRGHVLDSMHAALEDPLRSLSDASLVSVAIMASYEALFGSRENHHIHMIGLARMVELRGGLRELGLNGLLDPLLLWYDANTASVVGSPLYLKGLRSAAMYRQANREGFLLGVIPAWCR